jgi:hypothetical protein
VGTVLCGIAALLLWRKRIGRGEIVGGVGAVLLVLGLLQPRLLAPISRVWWRFAALLGWFNARVLLSVLFFLVLTPLGLAWKMVGKDPLVRRRASWKGWSTYPARYKDTQHFTRMY